MLNREIKFRGWDLLNNRWVYGFLIIWPSGEHEIIAPDSDSSADKLTVDKSSVGQATGMLDDNEVEIYEGDIVQPYRRIGRGKSKMRMDCVQYSKNTGGWLPQGLGNGLTQIISSNYKNPELLNQ